ncbi:unnamed protein product [Agarophyton chilense]
MTTIESPEPRILPPVKPPRIIVEHFDVSTYKIDQEHGYVEAACRHCGATIKGQKNVTSNFIQHMRRRHADEYTKFSAGAQPRQKRPRLSNTPRSRGILNSPVAAVAPKPFQTADVLLETAVVSATFRAAVRTPCELMNALSQRIACSLFIKREDMQKGGSSVFRAAYNHISNTPIAKSGVMCRGTDALPVAIAAQQHGKPCSVLVKKSPSIARRRQLTAAEAKVVYVPDDSIEVVHALAAEQNRTLVEVAADLRGGVDHAIAGYATLGLEVLQQCAHSHAIFVRAGNAPLFAALAAVLHRLGRGVKLVAVVMQGVRMNEDWRAFVNEVVHVSYADMCGAVKAVFDDCDVMLQPEGAMAVAGALQYATGHSLMHERLLCLADRPLRDFAQMRRVADLAERVDGSQCFLQVSASMGDMSFEELIRALGAVQVKRVRYVGEWPVLIGISCDGERSKDSVIASLAELGLSAKDVSDCYAEDVNVVEWATVAVDEGKSATVFRVEIEESRDGVRKLLGKQRAGVELERVSYRYDGSELGTILFGVHGEEWQLAKLESELMGEALSVRRVRQSDNGGLRLLGYRLGDDEEPRVAEVERAGNVVPDVEAAAAVGEAAEAARPYLAAGRAAQEHSLLAEGRGMRFQPERGEAAVEVHREERVLQPLPKRTEAAVVHCLDTASNVRL